eukprot:ANDGO_01585.mRNA.1 hypothetical protein
MLSMVIPIVQLVLVGLWMLAFLAFRICRRKHAGRRQRGSGPHIEKPPFRFEHAQNDQGGVDAARSAADGLQLQLENDIVDLPVIPLYSLVLTGFACSLLPECPRWLRLCIRSLIVCSFGMVEAVKIVDLLSESGYAVYGSLVELILLSVFVALVMYQWSCYERVGPIIHTTFPSVNKSRMQQLHSSVLRRSLVAVGVGVAAAWLNAYINFITYGESASSLQLWSDGCFYSIPYVSIFIGVIPVAYLCKIMVLLQLNVTEELFYWAVRSRASSNERVDEDQDGAGVYPSAVSTERQTSRISLSQILDLFAKQQALALGISASLTAFVFPLVFLFFFFLVGAIASLFESSVGSLFLTCMALAMFVLLLLCVSPAAEASQQTKRFARLVSHITVGHVVDELQLELYVPISSVANTGKSASKVPKKQFHRAVIEWSELTRRRSQMGDTPLRQLQASKSVSASVLASDSDGTSRRSADLMLLSTFFATLRNECQPVSIMGMDVTYRAMLKLIGMSTAIFSFLFERTLLSN